MYFLHKFKVGNTSIIEYDFTPWSKIIFACPPYPDPISIILKFDISPNCIVKLCSILRKFKVPGDISPVNG